MGKYMEPILVVHDEFHHVGDHQITLLTCAATAECPGKSNLGSTVSA